LPGFDAEIETPWGRIVDADVQIRELTSAYGAISRETVCKYGDVIYFLTSRGKIRALDGGRAIDISFPVENRVDSLFADREAMSTYAHLVGLDNTIKLTHDSSGAVLSMHIPTQTWGEEDFAAFTPERMFVYDSIDGVTDRSEIAFGEGGGKFHRQYRDGTQIDDGGNTEFAAEFPTVFEGGSNLYTVQRIDLRQEARTNFGLRYNIYDSDGDSLLTDLELIAAGTSKSLSWHVGDHTWAKYPFVRLWSIAGGSTGSGEGEVFYTNTFDIESIVFAIRYMGRIEVE
jgi:hypothetical protein